MKSLFDERNYSNPPWESEEPRKVFAECMEYLDVLNSITSDHSLAPFLKQCKTNHVISSVYFSNLIEDTGLPYSETYAICSDIIRGNNKGALHVTPSSNNSEDNIKNYPVKRLFNTFMLIVTWKMY